MKLRPFAGRSRWTIVAGAAVTLVVLLLGVGAALVVAFDDARTERVLGSGTRVVRIELQDFDIDPGHLVVDRGTHVVLDVVNVGSEVHDLAIDGGPRTRMLAGGESERLDVGRVTHTLDASCTVPGHKLLGMSLDIRPPTPRGAA